MDSNNENDNNENSKVGKAKIKKVIKDSYDLLKIGGNKKNVEKKKKDTRAKTSMKAYLEIKLEKLSGSLTKHNKQNITIKENMQTISNSCPEEQQPTINQLPKINKVPQINHNNVGTNETLEQVQEMHQLINQLQEMLERDSENLFGPANNLSFIHSRLFELELSRDNTMQEASTASQNVINEIRSYFNRLVEFSHYFTNHLWKLSANLIPLAKNGQTSTTIASIVRIIEMEEAADERARNSTKKVTRVIKSYKSNFLIQVQCSIMKLFEEKLQKYKESPIQLLDKLEFIFDDLTLVKDELDPLFSLDYNILSLFMLVYHRNVYEYTGEILQTDPNAGTILRLIRWVRHYYTFMDKKMHVSEDLMEPKLLDGREQALIDDYLSLMRSKFQEWKLNLMESDIKEFTQRQNQPELDSKNLAGLPGAPILIDMIRQQIDVAKESANYQLLIDVVNECCEVMSEVQHTWINLLESELQRYLDKPEESPDEIVIYIIALANDQLSFADFTNALSRQLASSLPEQHIKNIIDVLNNTMNGFLNVATNARNTILDIIYNDLKKPFRELHTAKWYKENTMGVIIITLEDYTKECQLHLKSYNLNKLMILMLDRFVIAYIESMRNKAVKFKMPHCIDKARQDIRSISEFFSQHIGIQESNLKLDVIYKLHDFLGTSKELIYLDYHALRKAYGDVPRKYLKIILSKRNDLDFLSIKKINNTLKAKDAEAGEYIGEPTVFSKITVKDLDGTAGDELKGDIKEVFHNMKMLKKKKKLSNDVTTTTNNFIRSR